jgi:hypothetical protein
MMIGWLKDSWEPCGNENPFPAKGKAKNNFAKTTHRFDPDEE